MYMNKFVVFLPVLLFASAQLAAKPPGNPPPIEVDAFIVNDEANAIPAFVTNDEANAIPVKHPSVEPIRPDDGQGSTGGFGALPVTCICEDQGCRTDRELGSDYLLQYVQVSFHADPGGTCSGSAGITASIELASSSSELVRLRVAENNNEASVLTLPQPILMKAGDELFCSSTGHGGEGACTLNVRFGGLRQ